MQLRRSNLAKLAQRCHDMLVIGGGINGAVSAAALFGMGAQVALIDCGAFAGLTSMNSSNIAWPCRGQRVSRPCKTSTARMNARFAA